MNEKTIFELRRQWEEFEETERKVARRIQITVYVTILNVLLTALNVWIMLRR